VALPISPRTWCFMRRVWRRKTWDSTPRHSSNIWGWRTPERSIIS